MLSGRPQQKRRLQSLAYTVRHHRDSVPHKLKSCKTPQPQNISFPDLSLVKEDDSVSTLLSALVRCRDSHVRMY